MRTVQLAWAALLVLAVLSGVFSFGSHDNDWHPSRDDYLKKLQKDRASFLTNNLTSAEIWPAPISTQTGSAILSIDPETFQFKAVTSGSILTAAFKRYMTYIFPWPSDSPSTSKASLITLNVVLTEPYNEKLTLETDETYILTITGTSAVLTSKTVFGALKGLETFSQIVQYNFYTRTYEVQEYKIIDGPRFPFRGVMLDTARRFMTVSSIKMVIDLMSYYKLNVLHLHLIDTDSWPLEVPGYPKFTLYNTYYPTKNHEYSPADINDIVSYALERGVRILPEIDTPGHSYPLCVAYPEYCVEYIQQNKTYAGLYPDPTNPDYWIFFAKILTVITDMFPGDQFHMGSDEMWFGQWQEAPAIKKFMEQMGYTTIQDVLYYYQRKTIDILRSLGKKILGWNPGLDNFPANWNVSQNYKDYQDVAFTTWIGWGGDWRSAFQQLTSEYGHVVLTGPYYVVDPRRTFSKSATWQEMYGTDPWNFTQTEELKQKYVLGAELVAWDDAAITDSANIVTALTPYLGAVGETWWSNIANGTKPDWYRYYVQRCRTVLRGVPSNPLAGDDIHPYHCYQDYQFPLNS